MTLTAFILSDTDYAKWTGSAQSYCDPTENTPPITPQWGQGGSEGGKHTKITINWTPKADGKYWLVTESYSNAGIEIVTVHLESPLVQLETSVSYSVSIQETVYATTQIITSTAVGESSQTSVPQSSSGDMSMILVALVIIIVAVAAVVLVLRRKKRTGS